MKNYFLILLVGILISCNTNQPSNIIDYSQYTSQVLFSADSNHGVWFEMKDSKHYNLVYKSEVKQFYKKLFVFTDFPSYTKVEWASDSLRYTNYITSIRYGPDSIIYNPDFPPIKIPIINPVSIDNDGILENMFGINKSYAYINGVFTDLKIKDLIDMGFINDTIFIKVDIYDYINRDSKNNMYKLQSDTIEVCFIQYQ